MYLVRLNDLFTQTEAYSASFVLALGMQSPEYLKDTLKMFRADPYSIVLNGKNPMISFLLSGNMNTWNHTFFMELYGIIN